jgi:hypothetical protein
MQNYLQAVASVVSALAAIGAVCMSYRNSQKIQSVHVSINSRMDELLRVSGLAERARGVEEGRAGVKSGK